MPSPDGMFSELEFMGREDNRRVETGAHDGIMVRPMSLPILEGLNPAQSAAVQYSGGPLLILAGAGTGKTRTITRRVAWLVESEGVAPERILAITFTNKAAREMRKRIEPWVPDGTWVGTFHATCARILRSDPEMVGRTSNFTICDTQDKRGILRRLIKDQGWDTTVHKPRKFETVISDWKRRQMGPAAAAEEASLYGLDEERCARIYEKYEQSLNSQDAFDFDDLLLRGLQLVSMDAKGDRKWAERFEHVLVDEYQDTNEIQYQLVRKLSDAHGNLSVCGDPDQSIYRWRGADIGNILRFEKDFPGTKVVRLEQNYRSVGMILKAAQGVIKRNTSRKEKDLFTDKEEGPPLCLIDNADEEAEAMAVARQASRWVDAGTSADEVAVFYRTNACSRSLEAAFTRLRIPYQVVGGQAFFERREIKDLMAYARLAVNPREDVSVERVLNVPPRGIGKKSVDQLREKAQECGEPLLKTMARSEVREQFRGPARKGLLHFLSIQAQVKDHFKRAAEAFQVILDRTGYRRFASALEATEDVDRGENIDELLAFASEYDDRVGDGLSGFLEEISLLTDVDRWEEGAARVSLMTVHAAKGLEFDRVAVVGLEEGLFPHARAFEEDEGLEEERRLFYVALTRAREEVCLSRARVRFRTGAPGPQSRSRFLDEIPDEVLPDRVFTSELSETSEEDEELEFCQGDPVTHRVFGDGTVQRVLGTGINQRLVVLFEETGEERTLLTSWSMLEAQV